MHRKTELIITIVGDALVLSAIYFITWKASALIEPITNWKALVGNVIILTFWLFILQCSNFYQSRVKIQIMNEIFKLIRTICLGLISIFALCYILGIDFINKAQAILI